MTAELPPRCFISHSYQDEAALARLIDLLPAGTRPFVFPPIRVNPNRMITNDLIEAILAQDGVIVLEEGASASSFWVAFERDYALRSGRPVFSFTPSTGRIAPLAASPMALPIFPSLSRRDHAAVTGILDVMRQERYFELSVPDEEMSAGPFLRDDMINQTLYRALNTGGYVVVFWSKNAAESKLVRRELERGFQYFPSEDPDYDRIIFALLDQTPLPDWYEARLANHPQSSHAVYPVQLYGDAQFSLLNRIDNLIVQLYWLIYRTSETNGLE